MCDSLVVMATTRNSALPAPPRVGQQRPGGRAARVRAAVLRATNELLAQVGYDALTYEEVASRADVHRTTVYRRWPTKPELVADAVGLHAEEQIQIPDSGSLPADLHALATAVAANLDSAGGARRSRSLVAAAATSEPLATALYAFMTRRVELADAIVERAAQRGEIPDHVDPRVVVEAVVGPIWFRVLLSGEPVNDDFVRAVANLAAAGAGGPPMAADRRTRATAPGTESGAESAGGPPPQGDPPPRRPPRQPQHGPQRRPCER